MAKRHYNDTWQTREIAEELFVRAQSNLGTSFDDRDLAALASDLADVFEEGEDQYTLLARIGGIGNLRAYVDAIRNNYFES